jgi:hypothetical protein
MKTVAVGVLFSLFGFGAEQPVRELETHAVPFRGSLISLFRHGYLVLFPTGAGNGASLASIAYGFSAYGPDGQFAYQEILDVPGGSEAVVRDVDFDLDGNAAVGISARGGPSGIISGILLLDRGGRQTSYIDTGRYLPTHIATAPDGSIWTIGSQRDAVPTADGLPRKDRQDYMIVRHFSVEGKQLDAYLPRSSFPPGLEPAYGGAGPYLAVTRDRVGILACSGKSSFNTEWVELDWNGSVLERSRTDDVLHGPASGAFTADDHIYLQGFNGQVYTLDHASHTWKSLQQAPGRLMGADDNSLVYNVAKNSGPILLEWFHQPAEPIQ